MRLVLLAAALLPLAACDSAPDGPDVLLGDWTAVETRSVAVVESAIDQRVLQFGTEGAGDLAVTGGGRQPLTVVERVGPADATVGTASRGARLQLRESALFPSEAWLEIDDSLYTARLPVGADLFTFADGRLRVAELTLVGEGGARRSLRVGGTRTVPTREVRAGEAFRLEGGGSPLRPDLGAYAIRFREDGTVRRRALTSSGEATPTFGRWEASGTDGLTLTLDGASVAYRYRVEAGDLVLERAGETFTGGEAVRGLEAELGAEPGSFTEVRYRSAVVLRRR